MKREYYNRYICMEGQEGISSGVTVKGDEAPDSYRVAARNENPNQFDVSSVVPPPPGMAAPPVSMAAQPVSMAAPALNPAVTPGTEVKKKRGRPRKYGPDGKLNMPLSPMPISASIPMTGEFSTTPWKRGRGRAVDSLKKQHKMEFESIPGERVAYSVGANFTPHVITVNAGEDVTMKILSFSQQGSRAICVLSANGAISNVTLRQPNSSGGTLTYEGRFEILSLSGSYLLTENGGTKSRTGGMSVSLAGPDGRVVGGGLAGLLVAAGPVQVVIGSFLPGHQQEQKPKKQKYERVSVASPTITARPVYGEDNWASLNIARNLGTDDTMSLPSGDPQGPTTQSKCEVSC